MKDTHMMHGVGHTLLHAVMHHDAIWRTLTISFPIVILVEGHHRLRWHPCTCNHKIKACYNDYAVHGGLTACTDLVCRLHSLKRSWHQRFVACLVKALKSWASSRWATCRTTTMWEFIFFFNLSEPTCGARIWYIQNTVPGFSAVEPPAGRSRCVFLISC